MMVILFGKDLSALVHPLLRTPLISIPDRRIYFYLMQGSFYLTLSIYSKTNLNLLTS